MAFGHKDGKGFDMNIEAVPLSGRVVLRLNEPRPTPEPLPLGRTKGSRAAPMVSTPR